MDSISRYSSSSDIIGNNSDLFTQILLCLTAKPLLVFKSVSKQWFSAISDPLFIKQHAQKQNLCSLMVQIETRNLGFEFEFISLDGSSSSSVSFETLDLPRARINQSCNGLCLLCCSSHKDYENFTYYICNPSTRQYRRIVDFTVDMAKEKGFDMLVSVSLAYDPLISPHYKAICVWKMPPEQCFSQYHAYQIEIYSSETDSWKLSGDVFYSPPSIINRNGVYWNGSLHWVHADTLEQESNICFNVDRELRTEMPMYRSLLYSEEYSVLEYFGECRGRLHLISRYMLRIIDILEMKTDYTGWIKKFRVNPQEFPYPAVMSRFSVLHVEEVEESFRLLLRIRDQVISYDLREMSFKDLYKFAPKTWKKISQDSCYQYIETLASV
ncbi:hypothetical protein MKW92_001921 [Papaver armeniacum]|nr:hypothetical protein MKW92_001921 [Papaver armeniacum]